MPYISSDANEFNRLIASPLEFQEEKEQQREQRELQRKQEADAEFQAKYGGLSLKEFYGNPVNKFWFISCFSLISIY